MSAQRSATAPMDFQQTLKDIEQAVKQATSPSEVSQECTGQPALPAEWQHIFHLASMAPTLLSYIEECLTIIEHDHLPGKADGYRHAKRLECRGERYWQHVMRLANNCQSLLHLADQGGRPPSAAIH